MERLYEAADALTTADHGKKSFVMAAHAEKMGMNASTLYRKLKKAGLVQSCRKIRDDKGSIKKEGLLEEHIKTVIAFANTSRRNTGTIEMPAEKAIMDCEANNLIPTGILTPDLLNRHLRRIEASKRDLLGKDCHQDMASLHPNHVHQMDPSVCLQWYFDDKGKGTAERDMVAVVYKNKPDELAKIVGKKTNKLMRYVLTDHFTGTLFVHYYYTPGESAVNAIDFLIRAWTRKQGDNPFHGAPRILLWDQGSANKGHSCRNFCEALNVDIITHIPHNPKAKGSVEKGNHIVQTWFESGLRITPAIDLDQLNSLAAKWCVWFNATRIHTRHGQTRHGLWQTINQEQLRIINAEEIQLRQLADGKTETRHVQTDYRIKMGKRDGLPVTFSLYDIEGVSPGKKVEVRCNPFDLDQCNIRVNMDSAWISVTRDAYKSQLEGGFPVLAAVFGENQKSKPDTQAMRHSRELDRIAFDVKTDAEAKSKRNKKEMPFADADAHKIINDFQSPAYMKRKGTAVPLAATAAPELLKGSRMLKRIIALRGKRLSPEENQYLKATYPNGMTDEDMRVWIHREIIDVTPLKAVN